MKLPFVHRIWHIKGALALDEPQLPASAFDKLDPLFQTRGTSYEIAGDTLHFNKHNPAAQDKLATFTRGTLRVFERDGRSVLAYDLASPALLACFLAPLLFLALAQATIAISEFESAGTEAEEKAKKEDKEEKEVKLHWLDAALGAPAPETADEKKKDKEKDKDKDKKHSPTAAYVLAAIFATLYIVGRILEPWLIKSLFRKTLAGIPLTGSAKPADQVEA